MNAASTVRATSWATTVHTPGPMRRGGPRDRGDVFVHAHTLHPHHAQPDVDDIGMRWAIAWYEGIQSYRQRSGHVGA